MNAPASLMRRSWLAVAGTCLMVLATGGAHAQPASAPPIVIAVPQSGETIHDNNGDVAVAVRLQGTALANGHRLRAIVDGRPAGDDQTTLSFTLRGIDRGEHLLLVQLVNANGNVIATSSQITFYMWRASAQFPLRKPASAKQ